MPCPPAEFSHAGFDGTSIDAIADRIGQTKGLIYYHFRSKVDIFYAGYERGMGMVSDDVAPHAGETVPARLAPMATAHLVNLMGNLAAIVADVLVGGFRAS